MLTTTIFPEIQQYQNTWTRNTHGILWLLCPTAGVSWAVKLFVMLFYAHLVSPVVYSYILLKFKKVEFDRKTCKNTEKRDLFALRLTL